MVNDRNINTLAKAAGRKVAVFQFDPTQKKLVQNVGAQPVSVDLTSVGESLIIVRLKSLLGQHCYLSRWN
jgi:TRAP-type C4-dicarboxylate transport system substrate-binding protein